MVYVGVVNEPLMHIMADLMREKFQSCAVCFVLFCPVSLPAWKLVSCKRSL